MAKKFGAIGVFGRANAGKSTLVNALVGERVSIVSNRPQTTRKRILGILTEGDFQMVFCDTPGLHLIRNELDSFMASEIEDALGGLHGGLYLVDAGDPAFEEDSRYLATMVPKIEGPVFLVINKIDRVPVARVDELASLYSGAFSFRKVFRVSAIHCLGLPEILEEVKSILPEGAFAYESDDYTSLSEREIVEEVIREEMLHRYSQEVPHSVAVQVEEFKERDNGKTFVSATLYMEKESHKKIVIGQKGQGIKALGVAAREKLNQILGRDIFLEIWVKVRQNWRKNPDQTRLMGYGIRRDKA
ncbi:GTPase Era [bacterium CG2_30_54_10]|nr:MAG: GTPase Era [bacterium CG2_30_54_10]